MTPPTLQDRAARNEQRRHRRRITARTVERVHRAAYDYEALAAACRAEGHEDAADTLQDVSRTLGKLARRWTI